MKKLFLFICDFFNRLFGFSPGPRERYFLKGLSSQGVYRTPAEKPEPEEPSPTVTVVEKEVSSPITPIPPLPPLPPLQPLPPLPPLDPLPPLKIRRTDDYSPIKNLNTKPTIKVGMVSREDALRLSRLPLTNDMAEVGDDTVHVPVRGGRSIVITPDYSTPNTEAKMALEKIIEQKVSDLEKEEK